MASSEDPSKFTPKAVAAWEAAAAFTVLAKDSSTTGTAPRQSDPTVNQLLDLVLDTSAFQQGTLHPISEIDAIHAWNLAVLKIGRVYLRAGTELRDIAVPATDVDVVQQIDRNVVEFAPEMGRYIDAQLWVQAAMADTVNSFLATASKSELDHYPNMKGGWTNIRSGFARTITGTISILPVDGLTDTWRRDRVAMVAAVGPRAAKFLLSEDLRLLRGMTTEAAGRLTDSTVKAKLTSLVATFEPS